jgi:hypothetical protein
VASREASADGHDRPGLLNTVSAFERAGAGTYSLVYESLAFGSLTADETRLWQS